MERLQQGRRLLGSDALFTLVGESVELINEQFDLLWEYADKFEQQFSRFKETSELTKLNLSAGDKFECSLELKNILLSAKSWGEKTDGIFNPFVLPALVESGYKNSFNTGSVAPIITNATKVTNVSELEIGESWVRIPRDSAIDLGGIGKGYLLDKLINIIMPRVNNFWLSIGGDIVGSGSDVDGSAWLINLEDAANKDLVTASAKMPTDSVWAVATSGINRRHGTQNDKAWNHLIDLRTGEPTQSDIATASLVTHSATEADVLASVAVIAGSVATASLLKNLSVDSYCLQLKTGEQVVQNGMINWQKEINHD